MYAGSLGELPGQLSAQAHAKLAPLPETVSDKRTELGSHALAALNHASLADVAVVDVGAAAAAGAPLQVLFLSTGPGMDCEGDNCSLEPAPTELAVSHPNLLVWVEEGASLELYQHYAGAGAYFTNALTRVALAEGSSLRHVYVQEQGNAAAHVDSLCVTCGAHAAYSSQLVQSGGRIARVSIDVSLDGAAPSGLRARARDGAPAERRPLAHHPRGARLRLEAGAAQRPRRRRSRRLPRSRRRPPRRRQHDGEPALPLPPPLRLGALPPPRPCAPPGTRPPRPSPRPLDSPAPHHRRRLASTSRRASRSTPTTSSAPTAPPSPISMTR